MIVVPIKRGEDYKAVVRKIDHDANRFKQIVRGKIKSDLRKYITHGELIGKTGGEFVSIPSLQDGALFDAYETARQAMLGKLSTATPAPRYRAA